MTDKPLVVWTFTGIITDISENEIIVVLLEPNTRKTVYKKIPRKDINFDCSEDDYIKIIINEYSDNKVNYKVEKHTISIDEKRKLRILQEIKIRSGDMI